MFGCTGRPAAGSPPRRRPASRRFRRHPALRVLLRRDCLLPLPLRGSDGLAFGDSPPQDPRHQLTEARWPQPPSTPAPAAICNVPSVCRSSR
jgi:hypothetical protein